MNKETLKRSRLRRLEVFGLLTGLGLGAYAALTGTSAVAVIAFVLFLIFTMTAFVWSRRTRDARDPRARAEAEAAGRTLVPEIVAAIATSGVLALLLILFPSAPVLDAVFALGLLFGILIPIGRRRIREGWDQDLLIKRLLIVSLFCYMFGAFVWAALDK